MKVKPISQKKETPPEYGGMQQKDVLDYPVVPRDPPDEIPEITQLELRDYSSAQFSLQLAKAHFELLRASLIMKFLRYCRVEPGNDSAYYDRENDRIVQVEDRRDLRDRLRK